MAGGVTPIDRDDAAVPQPDFAVRDWPGCAESEATLAEAGVGLWSYELASERLSLSPTCAALLGVSTLQLDGLQATNDFVHPDDWPARRDALKRALTGYGRYEVDYRVVHPDGRLAWVRSRGAVQLCSGKPHDIRGVLIDLSWLDIRAQGRVAITPAVSAAEVRNLWNVPELPGLPVHYAANQEIFGEGESADYLYLVASGAVRTYSLLKDGRRQVHAFYLPGDLLGVEASESYRLAAEAISNTTLVLFGIRQIRDAAERNPVIARRLWSATATNLRRAEDHLIRLGRLTATERVAAFIAELDERLDGSGWIDLPMGRRDLADYLGLTLETVSRAFSRLQASGALTLLGTRRIRLNDTFHAAQLRD